MSHQVAHFPHQRLMAIDHNFGGVSIIVEARDGDLRFDALDLFFPRGDTRLEVGDAPLKPLRFPLFLLALGFGALSFVARRSGGPAVLGFGV